MDMIGLSDWINAHPVIVWGVIVLVWGAVFGKLVFAARKAFAANRR